MRWLVERIREAGGQLEERSLDGLGDLAGEGYDAVVVAAGARRLPRRRLRPRLRLPQLRALRALRAALP